MLVNHIPLIVISLLAILFAVFYIYLKKQYRYWEERGIPGPKPDMLFGNMKNVFTLKQTEAERIADIYNEFKNEKYIGIFNLWKPTLLVNDLDLIKQMTEVDFTYFMDRPQFDGHAETDGLFDSLFFMKGNTWKQRRKCFSALFTPRKMKEYIVDFQKSLKVLQGQLEHHVEANEDIDLTKIFDSHSVRFITAALYGMDISADDQATNSFIEMANVFSYPTAGIAIKFMLYFISPDIHRFLRIRTFPTKVYEFYADLIKILMKSRETKNDERKDLITVLKKLKEEGANEFGSEYIKLKIQI